MTLHNLHPNPGATRDKKRLGRGRGSGKGKTSGKGVKGQKARPGHHGARFAFEGGQMPMPRRIPKRGFKNPNRDAPFVVNVSTLDKLFDAGATVDLDALRTKGLVPKLSEHFKVLGDGEIGKKIVLRAHAVSAVAKEKIEKAGGSVEIVSRSVPAKTAEG
ncbi:MAG: 50S ribosomal protein L15 [Deltaproteobacteria bacterium]|nr:50S ribosomal protein L15 [Deltaproteobacteria bacterium]MCW5805831.1 50S ribosomal protein L15 [Deltaproteobacteria bacterium]